MVPERSEWDYPLSYLPDKKDGALNPHQGRPRNSHPTKNRSLERSGTPEAQQGGQSPVSQQTGDRGRGTT